MHAAVRTLIMNLVSTDSRGVLPDIIFENRWSHSTIESSRVRYMLKDSCLNYSFASGNVMLASSLKH